MEQPSALHRTEAAMREPAAALSSHGWESDLADIAALPLVSLDTLAPLRPSARLLEEVLRARSSMRGGGEGPARAE